MKLRVATCLTLPEPDVDEAPLAAALAAAGIDAQLLAWDDPHADWDAPIPTIIRSTWNYALAVDAFLDWAERVSRAAPLFNPIDIVRSNVHKRYMLDLAQRGVPVVRTQLVEQGEHVEDVGRLLGFAAVELARSRIVIKPEVGGGSLGTKTFVLADEAEHERAKQHLRELTANGAALVQPYIDSVDDYGERSLIWIDGELTHAIRKTPRFAGDAEKIDGPFPISEAERSVAIAALAPYVDRILYGRVDVVHVTPDQPVVMELELVEPSLFFLREPSSLLRYIAGLKRRLNW